MNMIVRATEHACQWLLAHTAARRHVLFSGLEAEKHAAGSLLAGGKGKKVSAGVLLPARVCRAWLNATPEQVADVWRRTALGDFQGGSLGHNGQYANGLAALFIACGQDVANLANSAVGNTVFEVTAEGDLYASANLPSLTVGTVGGGTALGTGRECLEVLGCFGEGGAAKLAEITAAFLLAGDLSVTAAIASGEFVQAHETYGRNRPAPPAPTSPTAEVEA
jgi:hydroxymethylglutaryl-CoA reductase (NADPH)